jgi:hypothetical protein
MHGDDDYDEDRDEIKYINRGITDQSAERESR